MPTSKKNRVIPGGDAGGIGPETGIDHMVTVVQGIGPISTRTLYAEPKTFMESMLECSEFIDKVRKDPAFSKDDVLDSMEARISFLIGKMAASPTCMPFKIFPDPTEPTLPS